jgi:hypothetical protein
VRLAPLDPLTGHRHGARRGDHRAADHVEGGRLARAVGADQRDDLAGVHGEVQRVDRHDTAEALGQPLDDEQRRARRGTALAGQQRSVVDLSSRPGPGALADVRPAAQPPHRELERLVQPAGEEDHDEGQRDAEADQLDLAHGAGDQLGDDRAQALVQPLHREGADHGAVHRADPAEHGHQQELDRQREVGGVRVHHGDPVREGGARDRGVGRGEDEHLQPEPEGVHAERLGGDLGVVDGAEGPADAALDDVAGQQEPAQHDRRQQQEVLRGGVVRPPVHARLVDPEDAGRGAQEVGLGGQDRHDDAEAEGGQREVVPPQPEQRQADQQRRGHRHGHRDHRGEQRVDGVLRDEHGLRVGPDGEEAGLAQADLPASPISSDSPSAASE